MAFLTTQIWCIYNFDSRTTLAHPPEGVLMIMSLISWSMPKMFCSPWIVLWDNTKVSGTTAALWSFVSGICSRQLAALLFSSYQAFVSVYVVYLYISMDTASAWKKSHLILSDRSDFHIIDNQLIIFHVFAGHILSLSVNEMLLLRYVNWVIDYRGLLRELQRLLLV